MKKIIILCVLMISIYNALAQDCKTYKVLKIESRDSYHFITLERKSSQFLILSEKNDKEKRISKNKIVLGKSYKMILKDFIPSTLLLDETNYTYSVDDKIVWSSKGEYKSYITNCLQGLDYLAGDVECCD